MKFLITAGPTREPVDPVRFLSNRSSGKMGYALAAAARELGHEVVLISGPVALTAPEGADLLRVESAQQMFEAARDLVWQKSPPDIAIFAAAVADYRPRTISSQKIKKHGDELMLALERTPDILGSMRAEFGFGGVLVGFAAETENIIANAADKLRRKGCDLVVANDVGGAQGVFDSDENEVVLCLPGGGTEAIPRMPKRELAKILVARCVALAMAELRTPPTPNSN